MGIDIAASAKSKSSARKAPKSTNPFVQIIHKAYSNVARFTDSEFCGKVASRIALSKSNRPPMSLSLLAHHLQKNEGKIIVTTGTVTNDERLITVPKMTVCSLRFTSTARARIEKAGGRCLSFDELLQEKPNGEDCVILQGKRSHRDAVKHFGAAGIRGSKTKAKGQVWGSRGRNNGRSSW